ncbi:unnamed protein product [Fraxinus pennsylvanica]|uniref:C2 domain-containing protein n=1 Tax=Fraxinus pennsylvanica TaxID=56036 RepID=A0AAD1YZE2_9LAMI|nr:unnamed protein product [Fraxinus pennsylvanica]
MQNNNQPSILEITVVSAQDLSTATSSAIFRRRLRPFVTLDITVPFSQYRPATSSSNEHIQVYKTKVDYIGGKNPTWGDKFRLPIDVTFFYQIHFGICLKLYTKRLLWGRTQLGWCRIPAADMVDCLFLARSIRFLSYRLRARDGSRGHGIVNVAVKWEGSIPPVHPSRLLILDKPHSPENGASNRMVIGIPVRTSPD